MYKFLVGNKCDLADRRKVSYEQAKEFADQYGLKYMETSAKSAENVSESFITMTKEIIATNVEKEKAISKPGNIELMSVYNNLEKKVLLNSDNSKDLRPKEGYNSFLFNKKFLIFSI